VIDTATTQSAEMQRQPDQSAPLYTPTPIDTSETALPEELHELVEMLGQHVHEVWASLRMTEGWQYGPQRNDVLKEHPCIIPYEALPDSEREYDRNTAKESIKVILSLGYQILPPQK